MVCLCCVRMCRRRHDRSNSDVDDVGGLWAGVYNTTTLAWMYFVAWTNATNVRSGRCRCANRVCVGLLCLELWVHFRAMGHIPIIFLCSYIETDVFFFLLCFGNCTALYTERCSDRPEYLLTNTSNAYLSFCTVSRYIFVFSNRFFFHHAYVSMFVRP